MSKKPAFNKIRKRRWDAVLIGVAMSIAFTVIIMRFIDYWPCDILGTLKFESIVSCAGLLKRMWLLCMHLFNKARFG